MRVVVVLAGAVVLFSGCVAPPNHDSAESTAHAQLKALWDLDVDALVATYDERYFDFGSDRWIEDREQDIRAAMESQEMREAMAAIDSWQELVILSDVMTGHPNELEDGASFFQSDSFEVQPDDRVWFAPPAEGSPLFDGWGGLYREINGQWLMVAGD